MDGCRVLRSLGVTDENEAAIFTAEQRRSLDDEGYVILPNAFSPERCRQAADAFDRLSAMEGDEGGRETHTERGARRVSDIFNKTTAFDFCLTCKPLLAAAYHLLGDFKLHGANLREPSPGHGDQPLHVDDMRAGKQDWRLLNALFLFDDMAKGNGGTRVVPGSHHWPLLPWPGHPRPSDLSPDEEAKIPADTHATYPGEVYIAAPAGSIVAINGVIWHGGTRNISGARRRQLHLTFTRRDLPQQLDQRAYLTPALYDRLGPALRYLLDVEEIPAPA